MVSRRFKWKKIPIGMQIELSRACGVDEAAASDAFAELKTQFPPWKTGWTDMAKLDLKKHYRELYNPSAKECSNVVVPEMRFMITDGAGDPNTAPAYAEAIDALYAMSYGLIFLSKTTENVDYAVMSLEGLWWVRVMAEFLVGDK